MKSAHVGGPSLIATAHVCVCALIPCQCAVLMNMDMLVNGTLMAAGRPYGLQREREREKRESESEREREREKRYTAMSEQSKQSCISAKCYDSKRKRCKQKGHNISGYSMSFRSRINFYEHLIMP